MVDKPDRVASDQQMSVSLQHRCLEGLPKSYLPFTCTATLRGWEVQWLAPDHKLECKFEGNGSHVFLSSDSTCPGLCLKQSVCSKYSVLGLRDFPGITSMDRRTVHAGAQRDLCVTSKLLSWLGLPGRRAWPLGTIKHHMPLKRVDLSHLIGKMVINREFGIIKSFREKTTEWRLRM